MQSRLLFLTLVLRLSFTVTPIPRPDVALSVFDDGLLTTPPSNEQLFDIISPIENIESEVDLFSLNNCLDTANLLDPFWDGGALQAREDICPSRPPEAESSTDEENTGDPGDNANSHSSERINPDIPDTGFQFDNEPLRRMFSLPQDYQDERCNEYGFIRYAICSSGDFRDETKSMAYSFYPVQAYTLRRCTFMFNKFSICFSPGKIWCCAVYSEIGGFQVADGCVEVTALPGRLDGSMIRPPLL